MKVKRLALAIVAVFALILVSTVHFKFSNTIRSKQQIESMTGDVEAFEIILYGHEDEYGYVNRYRTFDYPQVGPDGQLKFYCAKEGCLKVIKHDGSYKIHHVHFNIDEYRKEEKKKENSKKIKMDKS